MEKIEETELKTLIDELRKQWNLMWWERIDDKLRAEGIAKREYSKLFIERGLVITATKDFKPLNFSEIVRQHIPQSDRWIPPNPSTGGWGKFIREVLRTQNPRVKTRRSSFTPEPSDKNKCGPPKKGGRGWLHA